MRKQLISNEVLNSINYNTYDRASDEYESLLEGIRKSFDEETRKQKPLFETNTSDLYDIFTNNLPSDARQIHDCRTCRNFVNRYGGLVRINDDDELEPVMWKYAPSFYKPAVDAVYNAVKNSKITGVFITSERRLGTPKTGYWTHMSVDVPKFMVFNNRLLNSYQKSAEKYEDFKMIQNAVNEYSIKTVESAVNLLRSDSMYRGEKVLGIAEWFLDVLKVAKGNPKRSNILWKRVATAPAGFCHISASMIGTLLDDISDGMDLESVRNRFNAKMNPLKYQRPQAAPTAGNVEQAEKIIAELGLENSLKRRFARLDEIDTVWRPAGKTYTLVTSTTPSAVFADIKTKESYSSKRDRAYTPQTTMTWSKFQRTVLPNAKKIELEIGIGVNTYAAIVTAEDPNSPPIIRWDTEEHRNPFSWYLYSGKSYPSEWNLSTSRAEVTGIALQPNLWQPGYEHNGEGVFFILNGCKDTHNRSSALFPEILRGELREVRSTIEAYSKQHKIGGYDEASACGLLLQSSRDDWKCTLHVTTDVGVSIYKLDRWD